MKIKNKLIRIFLYPIANYIYKNKFLNKRFKNLFFLLDLRLVPFFSNSFDDIYKKIYHKNDKLVIFDVGGNRGQSIIRFKSLFKNSKIYTFEPIPELCKHISLKFQNQGIQVCNLALSNKNGDQNLYVTANKGASSFYKINTNSQTISSLSKKLNVPPEKWIEKEIKVQTKKLDDFYTESKIDKIDILKIDTQGAEKLVLEGSENILSNQKIDIVEIEINIGYLYNQNNSTFTDIEKYLLKYKYKFLGLENNPDRAKNLIFNKELEFDLVYVSDNLFKKLNLR